MPSTRRHHAIFSQRAEEPSEMAGCAAVNRRACGQMNRRRSREG